MVDQNLVHARLEKMRQSVARLRELALSDEESFCRNADSCALAERHLQIAMQSAIDIGHHVVADMDLGLPQDYKDVFRILASHNIISEQLGKKLEAMTGMRNILVQDYLRLDLHRVYLALQNDLNDFDEFAAAVLKLI